MEGWYKHEERDLRGRDDEAKHEVGLEPTVLGGAVIPYLIGVDANRFGIQHAVFIPLLSYLNFAFY